MYNCFHNHIMYISPRARAGRRLCIIDIIIIIIIIIINNNDIITIIIIIINK